MEGWGKIGVQSASVLYPNSCYNESCYIEVQVYFPENVNWPSQLFPYMCIEVFIIFFFFPVGNRY